MTPSQCIVCSRCVRACEEVQGTFALTIEGRGFDIRVSAGMSRKLHRFGMRVLRRLRAGLPDRRAARKIGAPDGPPDPFGGDDLRLLRRRLLLQGGNARRRSGAHGAVEGRQGQSRPFLRQGPVRLWLFEPQGSHPQPDDPREDQRSVARSDAGTRPSRTSPASSAASSISMAAARSAASPRRAAPTRRPISSRSWCAQGFGNNNVDTCARVCHSPTGYGLGPTFGTSAGTQDFDSVEQTDVVDDHRRQPDRRPSGVRLAAEEAAAARRQADRASIRAAPTSCARRMSRRSITCR